MPGQPETRGGIPQDEGENQGTRGFWANEIPMNSPEIDTIPTMLSCYSCSFHVLIWSMCFFLSPVWLQSIGASYGAGGEPSAVVERKFRFRNVDLALDMAVF